MGLFVGRSDEQDRFQRVLADVAGGADIGPDEGHVVLVQGYGGIGKSTLLGRLADIAAGRVPEVSSSGRFMVAGVDWERDRDLHPERYALFAGPPIWQILERIRVALEQSAGQGRRERRRIESGFAGFLQQVAAVRELEQRAAELGIGHVLGRQRVTAEQIGKTLKAGTGLVELAGVPGAVTTTVGCALDATGQMVSAMRGDRERVELAAYRALVDEVDGVVTMFAAGIRDLARREPVVVVLDTCELLGGSGDWLRELTRRCGRRVVWVVGMRLEPDMQAGGDSETVRYRRGVDERRLRVITLSRFDDRTVTEYLTRRLGPLMPPGLDIGRIVALTHAIPLAVELLCDILADQLQTGHPIDDLYEEITTDGEVSTVVTDMARRYLVHASRENSELHADLPFLYGLALLHSDQDTHWRGQRTRLDRVDEVPHEPQPVAAARDPELLAALWNTQIEQVAAVMAGLARRHDFVHSRTSSLHRDVRDAIRLYLLTPVHRVMVTAMNQRTADHLIARLATMRHASIDDQLTDPAWRATIAGLLWHTCWINPPDGIAMLRHLYPPAAVLQPAFAGLLLDITTLFTPHCPTSDQHLLDGLTALSRHSRDLQPAARSAVDAIAAAQNPPQPLLAGPIKPYLSMLRADYARHLGLGLHEQLAQLRSAASAVRPDNGTTATRLGEIALGLYLPDVIATRSPHLGNALLAGHALAARYLRANPLAHANLGYTLSQLGRHDEAETALREAIRLDPGTAIAHTNLGATLNELGRFKEAEAVLRVAIRLDPDDAMAHINLGHTLSSQGQHDEAVIVLREAIRLDPGTAIAHTNLGATLNELGWFKEAEAVLREAIRLDPGTAIAHTNLGHTLSSLGRFEEAETARREAIRLGPGAAMAHTNLGPC